ncbi:MAG TPA: hypothetical protein VMC42_02945 [Methanoregulaceae archaeon]|nr:hypothetical protein [Methanoregulaceae archaeon]
MENEGKQKGGIFIREAVPGDLDSVALLYTHLFDNDEPAGYGMLKKAWQDILDDPRMHFFILERFSIPVSMCVLDIIPNLTAGPGGTV